MKPGGSTTGAGSDYSVSSKLATEGCPSRCSDPKDVARYELGCVFGVWRFLEADVGHAVNFESLRDDVPLDCGCQRLLLDEAQQDYGDEDERDHVEEYRCQRIVVGTDDDAAHCRGEFPDDGWSEGVAGTRGGASAAGHAIGQQLCQPGNEEASDKCRAQ